ncbi:RhoGAP-domain-containing protein [Phanerochaete sordida]|uniref:RhoGAP-domain-containing protein n=1 Tax=Phanerochaete sordida TaxID=48140 RepID=A0A9P3GH70_9APHY|nr:RhoGAP-domain-containing protein [Phanerochaete sordida]
MGQGQSRTGSSTQPPYPTTAASSPALPLPSSSNPIKRAWGRRKKSEDVTAAFAKALNFTEKGRGHDAETMGSVVSSALTTPAASVDDLQATSSVASLEPPSSLENPKFSGAPPIPPPKEELPSEGNSSVRLDASTRASSDPSPPLVISPGSSATLLYIQNQDEKKSQVPPADVVKDKPDNETKQDWRKSDATTMSYVTIRPNALSGTRSPRPVSLAESSHSGHTIVPANRRLSALITDAEFAMAEEDTDSEDDIVRVSTSGRRSPAASAKTRNRRSASLNIVSAHRSTLLDLTAVPTSHSETFPLARTMTETAHASPRPSQDYPTLNRVAASGVIGPSSPPGAAQSTSSNIRNRIAAWTAITSNERVPPPPPTSYPRRANAGANPSFRQTAISITGSLAPAALGLGKRAAEKVHRVWGGLSTSSSQSAYSSTSSLNGSISGQSTNGQVSLPGAWKSKRRTPNAPSGAWSVSSSVTNLSDADGFSGPSLGTRLRGPKLNKAGTPVVGGVVFGRDLWTCVQQTAIDSVQHQLEYGDFVDPVTKRPLEERMLPALIVRCAQHLHLWGLQEEGLFRLNGRPAHVAKLRAEFDSGADYNLVESDPGDLDPHAVASIFKAYLRELPQSLLTAGLIPLFEAALAADATTQESAAQAAGNTSPTSPGSSRGFPMLRKPPSLSTLAMPSFAGTRSMSDATIATLASLLAELPPVNRDLLYTVVELIQATSARSKETRMTLGNLLLVFCPSLNMSPPLLRVLCEAPRIWDGRPLSSRTHSVVESQDNRASYGQQDDAASVYSEYSDTPPRLSLGAGVRSSALYAPELGFGGSSPYRSSNNSSSGQDDAASYVSALDHPPSPSDDSSSNLPALTTSTDSLATPSTMSEASSFQPAIVPEDEDTSDKSPYPSPGAPIIANPIDLSLPNPRRPFISSPVPFPSTPSQPDNSSPTSPVSPRKSLTLLSFPQLGKTDKSEHSVIESSPTWSHRQRQKRPSLQLLFSKKSASPLSSPAISGPETIEPPAGMACVPIVQAQKDAPPSLDTRIPTSPISMFDAEDDDRKTPAEIKVTEFSRSLNSLPLPDATRERKESSVSSGSSLFSTPQQTPIADYFRGQSPSLLSVNGRGSEAASSRSASPNIRGSPLRTSDTPVIAVPVEADGDWSASVLKEAETSSRSSEESERSRTWRVKNPLNVFGSR